MSRYGGGRDGGYSRDSGGGRDSGYGRDGGGGGRSAAERGCKVYVGNLGERASKSELEKEFGHFGPVKSVWIARNPPGFAFVEFEDPRDASDAVKDLDSRTICGQKATVELSSGDSRRRGGFRGGGGGSFRGGRGGPPRGDLKCYECGGLGHFARDCNGKRSSGGYGGGRRRSYSRSRSRSRSRSPPPKRDGYSRSRSRSR